MDNFEFLAPNLPKNGFWGQNFKNISLDSESVPSRYYVIYFQSKWTTLNFSTYIWGNCPITLRGIFWIEYCWGCCRELSGGWNELGGGGCSWVEKGARFSNTPHIINLSHPMPCKTQKQIISYIISGEKCCFNKLEK